ncbi:hypothetical protein LPB03_11920 [Polaribacter vadi]|uniref:Beta-lactamase-related domain-containing protein n=1 Tax=Polaribacter vadi TaxID=1774273 RepID=A0A1B8TTT7_9FLAO|nr:serine hydrolase domain-containing protein [Polaribacter vadi]AOW18117.1 hypothetical protein LPB03_11920 [Polaribacter vadi]OBY62845.1 hypothetical protein LPB3_11930 [Polaribacter vadi]
MKKILISIFLVIQFISIIGCQQKKGKASLITTQNNNPKIDSLFKAHYLQNLFHGGVVITQKGKTLYENYLGVADRSWNILIKKDVKFDIASVNKSMIAALVLKAVEEGKLRLDDKLVDLLSGFSYEGSFHSEITLHHMLSHSSGLPNYNNIDKKLRKNNFLTFKRLRFTNESYINFISKIKPVSKPDHQFYYSNFAYHLISIILEQTYKKPFGKILQEKLTLPLGLKNTISESKNEVVISQIAKAYNYQEETGKWHQNLFMDLSLGRRIFSTASDLNRWGQVMDNPGWLTKESLNLMKQNQQKEINKKYSYGYGWVVFDGENKSEMGNLEISQPYIIHGGSTEGYKAMLININNGKYVISFLSNIGNKTQEMQLAQKIVNILIKK